MDCLTAPVGRHKFIFESLVASKQMQPIPHEAEDVEAFRDQMPKLTSSIAKHIKHPVAAAAAVKASLRAGSLKLSGVVYNSLQPGCPACRSLAIAALVPSGVSLFQVQASMVTSSHRATWDAMHSIL